MGIIKKLGQRIGEKVGEKFEETILGAVAQFVFDRLICAPVLSFFRQSKFDESLVENLKQLMSDAKVLILDAEEKSLTNRDVKRWLADLKHWFYRAEEVVDDIEAKAQQSALESPPQPLAKLPRLALPFSSSSSRTQTKVDANETSGIVSALTEIVSKLEDLLSQKDRLGLRELCFVGSRPTRETTSLFGDSKVYGRDEDRGRILEFLLSEEPQRSKIGVVGIVGMGGIGKTTLAKFVFNHESLNGVFDPKVWVCVSDQYDITRVTRSILESVAQKPYSASLDLNFLQNQLSSRLREKRFLLVFDDVWNEKHGDWELLRTPLFSGSKGSKIIMTTRNEEVASMMSPTTVFRPKPLSSDDGLSLLFRHAFEDGSLNVNTDLEEIGRKIVDKCQGLPLAIKTIGRLLCGNRDIHEWEVILCSGLWELFKGKSDVNPALWLSYYHLDPCLKRCFSYCAIFPKDHEIDRKMLARLWKAENFLDNEKGLEDVDRYVRQLLSRSFLEPVEDNEESYVIMHDLMHDLAQEVNGDFIARNELNSPSKSWKRARHFSYNIDLFDGNMKFQAIDEAKYLRTFIQLDLCEKDRQLPLNPTCYLSDRIKTEVIPSLTYLRVLSLQGYEIFELPESIGYLKQLRYLDISRTQIRQLPKSVSTLYNLQTLLLSDCRRLESLLADVGNLRLLHHLDIRGTTSLLEMPKRMSNLKSLQTLTDFVVGKNSGLQVKELRELEHIQGEFALRRLQNVTNPNDAIYAHLSDRRAIKKLALEFDVDKSDDFDIDVQVHLQLLENLKPPSNLEELTIQKFSGRRFPSWLDILHVEYRKLTFLRLSGCLYCQSLPPLGQLPSLKKLQIEGLGNIKTVGHEFYGFNNSSPFQALEDLCFAEMKEWEVWSKVDAKGSAVFFPRLQMLRLRDCPKLKGRLPIHTPLLKKVEIDSCLELGGLILNAPSFMHAKLAVTFDVASIIDMRLVRLLQLVQIPSELSRLSSLTSLRIKSCENLQSLANLQLPPQLELLKIKQCKDLKSLPGGLASLTHLAILSLQECPCLSWAPGDSLPTSLSTLFVSRCERWEFPITIEMMQKYTSLKNLSLIYIANSLVSFPLGIFPNLTMLSLGGCEHLEKVYVPESEGNNLTSLEVLYMIECSKLEIVGNTTTRGEASVLVVPNLAHLLIEFCRKVKPVIIETEEDVLLPKLTQPVIEKIPSQWIPWRGLLKFSYLKELTLQDEPVERFPNEDFVSLPTSLTKLKIVRFPKLSGLDGMALQSLTSLQELLIFYCPQLERLPKEGLPPSLGLLSILNCPKVEERCKRKESRERYIIRQIPCVVMDDHILVPDTHGIRVRFNYE